MKSRSGDKHGRKGRDMENAIREGRGQMTIGNSVKIELLCSVGFTNVGGSVQLRNSKTGALKKPDK